jgi:CRISPR-associated endoribonuclease Cas2 subtype I-E
MVIIVNESLPTAVTGWLSQWFIEVQHNVYIGTMNVRVRNEVITYVQRNRSPGGAALCVYPKQGEPGFAIECIGTPSMALESFDGLILPVRRKP